MTTGPRFVDGAAVWKSWDMPRALRAVRLIERLAEPRGMHAALAGGVMKRGRSAHDLDVVLYPRQIDEPVGYDSLVADLALRGFRRFVAVRAIHRDWRARGITDRKHHACPVVTHRSHR